MPTALPDALDVLIVGGGPSGAAAALTLQLHTPWRVGLIEGTRYDQPRVGENVSFALHRQLAYLHAEELVSRAESALPAYRTQSAWGSAAIQARDAIFMGHGAGLLLDRRRFDEGLVDLFRARGGATLQGAWLRRAAWQDDAWCVTFEHAGVEHSARARQVIDATGRRAAFARRAGAEVASVDRLVAVVRHVHRPAGTPVASGVLVEAVAEGWWYSAPLPGDQAVFAFMTDADMLTKSRLATPDAFDERLRHAPATQLRAQACARGAPCHVHPAATQVLLPSCGPGWVAAGDALLAVDPLSSIGIGHAIESGIHAARLVNFRLHGRTDRDAAYRRGTARRLDAFRTQRATIYAQERRWADSTFWQRRQGAAPMFLDPLSPASWAIVNLEDDAARAALRE